MKVAVTGKGGVGKTTFSSILARLYAEEGKSVLAADVDPDANLGLALGFSEEELDELRGLIYSASFVAEKNGFKMGVHVAVKFLTEALNVTRK